MSSGSKKQTVGYWYRLLVHYGWCKGPIDAFLEMRGGDRTAWKGLLARSGRIRVNKPDLWGGRKSEGGLDGEFDVMFGEADQLPNDYLTAQLGADQPAYRGKATGVWRGGRYGAMNPYPKPLSFKLRRILKGWDNDEPWYPEKAEIHMIPPEPLALYFSLDLSGSMDSITPNGRTRLENMQAAVNAVLQLIQDVLLPLKVPVDIMIVGWSGAESTRKSIQRRQVGAASIQALKNWVNGLVASGLTNFPAGLVDMQPFFTAADPGSQHLVFFITDGEPNFEEQNPIVIARQAAALVAAQPNASVYAFNIDLKNTRYTEYVDNTPDDGVPVIRGDDPDAITNGILGAIGGLIGMNPAHILYDSLTAADMQGEPRGLINEASFKAAADKLHDEGFGLCTAYEDEEIEAFQQRICDVIGACLTQSRVNGQYYLDLIRGDYQLSELPIISSDDIIEFSQEPTLITETVNQVAVEWFDPQTKEDRTTQPVQALGAIQIAGGVIAEVRSYPEIPIETLALRTAARDLLAKSTPTSRFNLTTNRRPWKLRPGQYFRLQCPEEGIADMVCLVGDIDLGTLTDGRIKLKAVQDVFAFPDTVYVQPESGQATAPDLTPVASPAQALFEAPYFELVRSMSHADLAAFPPDAGILMTAAMRAPTGLNYSIYSGAEGEELADNGAAEWCPSAVVVEAAGYLDTDFTFAAGTDLENVEIGSWALWGDEIVRVDALDTEARTVSLGRGCADTVPARHSANSRILFCGDWSGTDEREYVDGETVYAKLLTRTSTAEQPLQTAQELEVTMVERYIRPYPPGRFRINGFAEPARVVGDITITWAHRDRLLQADKLLDTEQDDIGPEPNVTYSVRLSREEDDVELIEVDDIVGASALISPPQEGLLALELAAVREGLRSWQTHRRVFEYLFNEPLPVDEAIPEVLSVVETSISPAGAVHNIALPLTNPGDLLVVVAGARSGVNPTLPVGWMAHTQAATGMRNVLLYRISDGSEGAHISVMYPASCTGLAFAYRIKAGTFHLNGNHPALYWQALSASAGTNQLNVVSRPPIEGGRNQLNIGAVFVADGSASVETLPFTRRQLRQSVPGGEGFVAAVSDNDDSTYPIAASFGFDASYVTSGRVITVRGQFAASSPEISHELSVRTDLQGASSLVFALPETIVPGDLLVLFAMASSADFNTPTGWTIGHHLLHSGFIRMAIFTKTALEEDIGANVTFSLSNSAFFSVKLYKAASGTHGGSVIVAGRSPQSSSIRQSTPAISAGIEFEGRDNGLLLLAAQLAGSSAVGVTYPLPRQQMSIGTFRPSGHDVHNCAGSLEGADCPAFEFVYSVSTHSSQFAIFVNGRAVED